LIPFSRRSDQQVQYTVAGKFLQLFLREVRASSVAKCAAEF